MGEQKKDLKSLDADLDEEAGSGASRGILGALIGNRLVIILVVVGVIGAIVMIGFTSRGEKKQVKKYKYVEVYSELLDDEISRVTEELSFDGIPFKTTKKAKYYTLLLPEEMADDARQILARKGLPTGGSRGFELFDKAEGLGATEFDKRIKFVRALSGEIERAISRLQHIETTKVHIVMPEKKLFTVKQEKVKASILIGLKRGEKLNNNQIYGIILLAANSVEGLDPENVTVIDDSGDVISNGVLQAIADESSIYKLAHESLAVSPIVEPPQALVETVPDTIVAKEPEVKPVVKEIDWLSVKKQYEQSLRDKANKQLLLILPPESYDLEVNVEIGDIVNGVPQIKRIDVSIVIDTADDRVIIDDIEKKKIFASIAGSVGYQKGRDQITLRRVLFKNKTQSAHKSVSILSGIDKTLRPKAIFLLLGFVFLLVLWIRRRIKRKGMDEDEDNPEEKQAKEEQELQTAIEKNRPSIAELQKVAIENPDVIVNMIKGWLKEVPKGK